MEIFKKNIYSRRMFMWEKILDTFIYGGLFFSLFWGGLLFLHADYTRMENRMK